MPSEQLCHLRAIAALLNRGRDESLVLNLELKSAWRSL